MVENEPKSVIAAGNQPACWQAGLRSIVRAMD